MIYILDTDILSLLAQDSPEAPRIRRRIVELPTEDVVATTIINFEEQMRGWMAVLSRAKSARAEIESYTRLIDHLTTFRRMAVCRTIMLLPLSRSSFVNNAFELVRWTLK